MTPEPEDDGNAARAFEALRAEMAALRRGVELVYRRGQQAGTAPDYSLTLGTMVQTLQAIMGRLEAVEQAPAHQAAELRRELSRSGRTHGAG
jgi:hypothetical protein